MFFSPSAARFTDGVCDKGVFFCADLNRTNGRNDLRLCLNGSPRIRLGRLRRYLFVRLTYHLKKFLALPANYLIILSALFIFLFWNFYCNGSR